MCVKRGKSFELFVYCWRCFCGEVFKFFYVVFGSFDYGLEVLGGVVVVVGSCFLVWG